MGQHQSKRRTQLRGGGVLADGCHRHNPGCRERIRGGNGTECDDSAPVVCLDVRSALSVLCLSYSG